MSWPEYIDLQECVYCGEECPEEDMIFHQRTQTYLCSQDCLDDASGEGL